MNQSNRSQRDHLGIHLPQHKRSDKSPGRKDRVLLSYLWFYIVKSVRLVNQLGFRRIKQWTDSDGTWLELKSSNGSIHLIPPQFALNLNLAWIPGRWDHLRLETDGFNDDNIDVIFASFFNHFLSRFWVIFESFLSHVCAFFLSFQRYFCVVFASFLRHFDVILASFWRHFWVIFESLLSLFWVIFESFWNQFWVIFESFLSHFRVIFSSILGHFGDIFSSFF